MRILDSKDQTDKQIIQQAPTIGLFLSPDEKKHFQTVTEGLDTLNISYKIDPFLVRGLDYYTDTVFELIREEDFSGQNTLAAGGVYNGLIKKLGGKDLPGIGFAIGIERTIQAMLEENKSLPIPSPILFYCIGLNQPCKKNSSRIYYQRSEKTQKNRTI